MTGPCRTGLGRLVQYQWPFLCGFLALPVFALFVLAATLVSPGYSHTTDTISHLGGGGSPHPWIANTGILLYGLMVLAFAYGLGLHFGASPEGKVLSALVAINATAILFAVFFEVGWGEIQLEAAALGSTVHEVAARAGFTSLAIAMVLFPVVVWGRPQWRRVRWALQGLALLGAFFGFLFAVGAFQDYSGVVQRCFFATCGIWAQVVALQVMRTE